jgi:fructose-1,6-bisphosphatase/sedoheptulose 1,7-bisphosphatase-like protein
MEIGDALDAAMAHNRMTNADVATAIGASPEAVMRWRSKVRIPGGAFLVRMLVRIPRFGRLLLGMKTLP